MSGKVGVPREPNTLSLTEYTSHYRGGIKVYFLFKGYWALWLGSLSETVGSPTDLCLQGYLKHWTALTWTRAVLLRQQPGP